MRSSNPKHLINNNVTFGDSYEYYGVRGLTPEMLADLFSTDKKEESQPTANDNASANAPQNNQRNNNHPLIPDSAVVNQPITVNTNYKGLMFSGSADDIIKQCEQINSAKSTSSPQFKNT